MNTQPPHNRRRHVGIQILLGSTPKPIGVMEDVLAAPTDKDATSYTLRLIFDFAEQPPADLAPPTVAFRPAGSTFFIPAVRPVDASSLKQAEEEGLITAPADGWSQQSRGSADNEGAGGVPREGSEIADLNGRKIQDRLNQLMKEAIAYARRDAEVTKGRDPGSDIGRIPIHIMASTAGGMGAGSLIPFIRDYVVSCARENGIEPKIVVELLCLGNLQTHDIGLARINELTTLWTLRAFATGSYVDALTGRVMPIPFEYVCLFSNINNHGNFTSLKELISHQAHLIHFIARTPAGSDLRERMPDMANWGRGEYGDPRCGYTGSIAIVHLDRPRLRDCCGYMAAGKLIQSFLIEEDRERMTDEAAAFAAIHKLVESSDQNQLTASICRPDTLAGETVLARADQSFIGRVVRTRGRNGAILRIETIEGIRNNDVGSVYGPQMRGQAQAMAVRIGQALAERLDQFLRRPEGLSEAILFLQLVLLILERSQRAIIEKANEIQEYRASHEQVLADAAEQLQQLSEQNPLRRLINLQLLRSLTAALEQSGRATISYDLQIAACNIAIESLLVPLSDLLQRKLARLVSVRQRFVELAQHCVNKAKSRVEEPVVFEVPVGIELVTAPYVGAWFAEHVAQSGGPESFIACLQGQFLQQYGSLAALAEASFQEMEEAFVRVGRTLFAPGIENTNVLAEFRRVFPEYTHQKIATELIGRCEGRLLIEGEVNRVVAWAKTANVPLPEDTGWVANMLENADRKGGKWQVAAHPADPETFSMVQFRGDLLLTPLINRLDLPDTYESWKRLIPVAADPVSAIGVGPNPTERQFRRVLAKAIAGELLTVEDKGCLAFHSSLGESWLVGKDATAVHEKLHPRWDQIVYVESYFASELVDHEAQIIAKLEQMMAALTSKEPVSDKRFQLIDVTAITECLQQIELLRPWTRKTHKARRRISS